MFGRTPHQLCSVCTFATPFAIDRIDIDFPSNCHFDLKTPAPAAMRYYSKSRIADFQSASLALRGSLLPPFARDQASNRRALLRVRGLRHGGGHLCSLRRPLPFRRPALPLRAFGPLPACVCAVVVLRHGSDSLRCHHLKTDLPGSDEPSRVTCPSSPSCAVPSEHFRWLPRLISTHRRSDAFQGTHRTR